LQRKLLGERKRDLTISLFVFPYFFFLFAFSPPLPKVGTDWLFFIFDVAG
jgi:hypothetical protein